MAAKRLSFSKHYMLYNHYFLVQHNLKYRQYTIVFNLVMTNSLQTYTYNELNKKNIDGNNTIAFSYNFKRAN